MRFLFQKMCDQLKNNNIQVLDSKVASNVVVKSDSINNHIFGIDAV